jgi:hypothetical protein
MNMFFKSIISSIVIGISVVSFVDIVAENETSAEDMFDNGNTKPMLASYIDVMKEHSQVAIAEEKYAFNLINCEEVIKTALPFQEDYKGCENNIVLANTYLTSL